MSALTRIQLQPAYLLHHRPYRDTSRILELFTRDHGRITVFARGVRGGKGTTFGSALQSFHRVLVSYSNRGDAGQLTGVEFDGAMNEFPAARTLSGFYLNELILRLFERHDPHGDVFALYDATVTALKRGESDESLLLRIFEKRLLELLGYGLPLSFDCDIGEPITAERYYRFIAERGLIAFQGVSDGDNCFLGRSLLALRDEDLSDSSVRSDARRLLRAALDNYLSGRVLKSREVMHSLRRMR